MVKHYLLLVLLLTFSIQAADNTQPKRFVLSHVAHPEIGKLQDIIRNVYKKIGYEAEFIQVPAYRGIELLEKGIVDGDIARIDTSIENQLNILLVRPPIANIEIALICNKGVPCTAKILQDKNAIVLSGKKMFHSMKIADVQAQVIFNEKSQIMLELMKVGRYNYVLYAVTPAFKERFSQDFNISTLAKPNIYHVINKKHRNLLPQLEKALHAELVKQNLVNLSNTDN